MRGVSDCWESAREDALVKSALASLLIRRACCRTTQVSSDSRMQIAKAVPPSGELQHQVACCLQLVFSSINASRGVEAAQQLNHAS